MNWKRSSGSKPSRNLAAKKATYQKLSKNPCEHGLPKTNEHTNKQCITIGLSTKAPRFEFVFTPTNKQLSQEKDCFSESPFFGFL
jgi:hypothetical protein